MQVAKIILEQIGGRRFSMMTGSKNYVGGENFLQMDLARGMKNGANKLKITLEPSDTYTMTFYKWNARKLEMTVIEEIKDVYCDMLQDIFTDRTGFFTKL